MRKRKGRSSASGSAADDAGNSEPAAAAAAAAAAKQDDDNGGGAKKKKIRPSPDSDAGLVVVRKDSTRSISNKTRKRKAKHNETKKSAGTTTKMQPRKSKNIDGDGGSGKGKESGKGEAWSKSKKKRIRQLKAKQRRMEEEGRDGGSQAGCLGGGGKMQKSHGSAGDREEVAGEGASPTVAEEGRRTTAETKPSALQSSFRSRLSGSRFRILNEELYTATSAESFDRFSSEPQLYEQYHEGFRTQVENWPSNPVDVLARSIVERELPRFLGGGGSGGKRGGGGNQEQVVVVADFGCGDAALAKKLLAVKKEEKKSVVAAAADADGKNKKKKGKESHGGNAYCPFKVHSFDLVACCDLVTACDMAKVPLPDGSVDVGVFCLSLMGTNLADFVREAHRVLKGDGVLKIAEVRSRFETTTTTAAAADRGGKGGNKQNKNNNSTIGGASIDGELKEFIKVLDQLGFDCVKTDRSNKMFILLDLKKNGKKPKRNLDFTAKPCIYKRR